jgi:hypothetical protein
MGGSPSAAKKALGSAMERAGEVAIRHGPCGLPAVCAARALPAPMFILSMSLISKAFAPDSIFGRDTAEQK